jgi:nicotinamide-nucleotide amidase
LKQPLHKTMSSAAILAVGSEMLGPTRLDTNSLKITSVLELYGVPLVHKAIAGDRSADVVDAIRYALGHADLLVITGGLGPTEDDLTREAVSAALGLDLIEDASMVERLRQRFAARGLKMPETNLKQAQVFRGQETLLNERGSAPGFHITTPDKHLWMFPGVPSELEWMLETYFGPWLAQATGGRSRFRRVLKIAGMAESAVDEQLKPYYAKHADELLTILASPGGIELHVSAEGAEDEAKAAVASRERELLEIFGDRVFGFDDDTIESVIGELLVGRGETLATAESCTGGMLGSRITEVAGSSRYYRGGGVCYTAEAKIMVAGVDAELIAKHGEVSEEVAVALAQGIRERFGATYGVGITGIAGPGGGSEAKPVGTVHIAVASPDRVEHRKLFWPATRHFVRWFSTQAALDLLRKTMLRRAPASRA